MIDGLSMYHSVDFFRNFYHLKQNCDNKQHANERFYLAL